MTRRVAVYNCVQGEELNTIQVMMLSELARSIPYWKFNAKKDAYSDVGCSKAKIEGRAALEELISKAKRGKYDLIVVKEVNNLLRNTELLMGLINDLSGYGVDFMFLENKVLTSETTMYALLFMVKEEAETTSGSDKDKVLGYKLVKTDEGIEYEQNIDQVLTVIQIYGRTLRGESLQEIKLALEFEGCLTATGGEVWTVDMLRDILRNPIYKGETPTGDEIIPIIDSEAWEVIQVILS